MFPRSSQTRRGSSPEIAYQPVATMDNDDNKDGQAGIPEVSHDELAIGSTRASDANELVVVLTEKEVSRPRHESCFSSPLI